MYVCMYVRTYVCMYMYTYTYVYIYIYVERERERERDLVVRHAGKLRDVLAFQPDIVYTQLTFIIGWRYLSNAASFVFYSITCLIRLIEFAALFTTFAEHMCQTIGVRQVLPPDIHIHHYTSFLTIFYHRILHIQIPIQYILHPNHLFILASVAKTEPNERACWRVHRVRVLYQQEYIYIYIYTHKLIILTIPLIMIMIMIMMIIQIIILTLKRSPLPLDGAHASDKLISVWLGKPVFYILQRGVQWKRGVVIYMMLYTILLYHSTPIHCTPLPLHPPVMNTQVLPLSVKNTPFSRASALQSFSRNYPPAPDLAL